MFQSIVGSFRCSISSLIRFVRSTFGHGDSSRLPKFGHGDLGLQPKSGHGYLGLGPKSGHGDLGLESKFGHGDLGLEPKFNVFWAEKVDKNCRISL